MVNKIIQPSFCTLCGEDTVIRLPEDWQALVEAGFAIPIIGCGNPWHYANIIQPLSRHPYTCGLCSWGRDGAYHDKAEYDNHMAHVHPDEKW